MRFPRYFDPDAVRTEMYMVRNYDEGDMSSLMTHLGDLVCNFDMLLVAIKGCSGARASVRYDPALGREKLEEAREYLVKIAERLDDAENLAWQLF